MKVESRDQVWSTVITYIPTASGFMCPAAVIDWHSRYVIARRLSNTLHGSFCLEMLEEALGSGKPEVFNADQGVQFTASAFTGIKAFQGATARMTTPASLAIIIGHAVIVYTSLRVAGAMFGGWLPAKYKVEIKRRRACG